MSIISLPIESRLRDIAVPIFATPLPAARQIMALDNAKISIRPSFFQHFLPKSWLF
jgi:hypothetical protein